MNHNSFIIENCLNSQRDVNKSLENKVPDESCRPAPSKDCEKMVDKDFSIELMLDIENYSNESISDMDSYKESEKLCWTKPVTEVEDASKKSASSCESKFYEDAGEEVFKAKESFRNSEFLCSNLNSESRKSCEDVIFDSKSNSDISFGMQNCSSDITNFDIANIESEGESNHSSKEFNLFFESKLRIGDPCETQMDPEDSLKDSEIYCFERQLESVNLVPSDLVNGCPTKEAIDDDPKETYLTCKNPESEHKLENENSIKFDLNVGYHSEEMMDNDNSEESYFSCKNSELETKFGNESCISSDFEIRCPSEEVMGNDDSKESYFSCKDQNLDSMLINVKSSIESDLETKCYSKEVINEDTSEESHFFSNDANSYESSLEVQDSSYLLCNERALEPRDLEKSNLNIQESSEVCCEPKIEDRGSNELNSKVQDPCCSNINLKTESSLESDIELEDCSMSYCSDSLLKSKDVNESILGVENPKVLYCESELDTRCSFESTVEIKDLEIKDSSALHCSQPSLNEDYSEELNLNSAQIGMNIKRGCEIPDVSNESHLKTEASESKQDVANYSKELKFSQNKSENNADSSTESKLEVETHLAIQEKDNFNCSCIRPYEENGSVLLGAWNELRSSLRQLHRSVIPASTLKSGSSNPRNRPSINRVKALSNMLLNHDPHQLFTRVYQLSQELCIELKVRLLSTIHDSPDDDEALSFIKGLCESYDWVINVCEALQVAFEKLESDYLSRFGMNWVTVNMHTFYATIFTDPDVQDYLAICSEKVEERVEAKDVLGCLSSLKKTLSVSENLWIKAEIHLQDYAIERTAVNTHRRNLLSGWGSLKNRPDFYENQTQLCPCTDCHKSETKNCRPVPVNSVSVDSSKELAKSCECHFCNSSVPQSHSGSVLASSSMSVLPPVSQPQLSLYPHIHGTSTNGDLTTNQVLDELGTLPASSSSKPPIFTNPYLGSDLLTEQLIREWDLAYGDTLTPPTMQSLTPSSSVNNTSSLSSQMDNLAVTSKIPYIGTNSGSHSSVSTQQTNQSSTFTTSVNSVTKSTTVLADSNGCQERKEELQKIVHLKQEQRQHAPTSSVITHTKNCSAPHSLPPQLPKNICNKIDGPPDSDLSDAEDWSSGDESEGFSSGSSNHKDAHCDCCYCHMLQNKPGGGRQRYSDRRERLLKILSHKKRTSISSSSSAPNSTVTTTTTTTATSTSSQVPSNNNQIGRQTLDEIMNYIEGERTTAKCSKKAAKKARKKERKLAMKKQEQRRNAEMRSDDDDDSEYMKRNKEVEEEEEEDGPLAELRRRAPDVTITVVKPGQKNANDKMTRNQIGMHKDGGNSSVKHPLASKPLSQPAAQPSSVWNPAPRATLPSGRLSSVPVSPYPKGPPVVSKESLVSNNNNTGGTGTGGLSSLLKGMESLKNQSSDKDGKSSQMVTIRRVMDPVSSEPTVTITLKGEEPKKDKVLFKLVNGQACPGNGTKGAKSPQQQKPKGKPQARPVYNIPEGMPPEEAKKLKKKMKRERQKLRKEEEERERQRQEQMKQLELKKRQAFLKQQEAHIKKQQAALERQQQELIRQQQAKAQSVNNNNNSNNNNNNANNSKKKKKNKKGKSGGETQAREKNAKGKNISALVYDGDDVARNFSLPPGVSINKVAGQPGMVTISNNMGSQFPQPFLSNPNLYQNNLLSSYPVGSRVNNSGFPVGPSSSMGYSGMYSGCGAPMSWNGGIDPCTGAPQESVIVVDTNSGTSAHASKSYFNSFDEMTSEEKVQAAIRGEIDFSLLNKAQRKRYKKCLNAVKVDEPFHLEKKLHSESKRSGNSNKNNNTTSRNLNCNKNIDKNTSKKKSDSKQNDNSKKNNAKKNDNIKKNDNSKRSDSGKKNEIKNNKKNDNSKKNDNTKNQNNNRKSDVTKKNDKKPENTKKNDKKIDNKKSNSSNNNNNNNSNNNKNKNNNTQKNNDRKQNVKNKPKSSNDTSKKNAKQENDKTNKPNIKKNTAATTSSSNSNSRCVKSPPKNFDKMSCEEKVQAAIKGDLDLSFLNQAQKKMYKCELKAIKEEQERAIQQQKEEDELMDKMYELAKIGTARSVNKNRGKNATKVKSDGSSASKVGSHSQGGKVQPAAKADKISDKKQKQVTSKDKNSNNSSKAEKNSDKKQKQVPSSNVNSNHSSKADKISDRKQKQVLSNNTSNNHSSKNQVTASSAKKGKEKLKHDTKVAEHKNIQNQQSTTKPKNIQKVNNPPKQQSQGHNQSKPGKQLESTKTKSVSQSHPQQPQKQAKGQKSSKPNPSVQNVTEQPGQSKKNSKKSTMQTSQQQQQQQHKLANSNKMSSLLFQDCPQQKVNHKVNSVPNSSLSSRVQTNSKGSMRSADSALGYSQHMSYDINSYGPSVGYANNDYGHEARYAQYLAANASTLANVEYETSNYNSHRLLDGGDDNSRIRNKKKVKRGHHLEDLNTIDSVFTPKELATGELDDETDREVEAFKRFCLYSVPRNTGQKPKVNFNVKDIMIKKKH